MLQEALDVLGGPEQSCGVGGGVQRGMSLPGGGGGPLGGRPPHGSARASSASSLGFSSARAA
eukprot:3363980-Pyramimonas_sp.AAC.1